MLTILHISDLHFGPPYLPAAGEAVVNFAAKLNADIVVASGDFTQRAKREQFAAARDFLKQLPAVPQVVVPGNHDVPLYRVAERLFRPHALYREYISSELNQVHRLERATIVALDSTAPRRAITNGRLRPSQHDFCTAAFRDSPADHVKIVVAHHHFCPAPDYQRDEIMPTARRSLEHFHKLGVELILGGHLHRSYIGNSRDVFPSHDSSPGILIVQSGTTTSRRGRARERQKNSLNVIRIDDSSIRVIVHGLDDTTKQFQPTSEHRFGRAGRSIES